MPLYASFFLTSVMVVATSSAFKLVLELDMDATVPLNDNMLEVEGASDRAEKEFFANREDKELEQVIIIKLGRKEGIYGIL